MLPYLQQLLKLLQTLLAAAELLFGCRCFILGLG